MGLKMCAAAVLAVTVATSVASPVTPRANNPISTIPLGTKWEIVLHQPIKYDDAADLIPQEAAIWDIDLAHANDKAVICYFNGGALQDWDEDKNEFPKEAKGKTLGGEYNDEWYLDVRNAEVVNIMKKRLDAAAAAGCDGVDPDNIDAWATADEDRTGFGLKQNDYVKYLTALAEHGHSIQTTSGAPLLVGQKNAPEIASRLVSVLDFAVLESCLDWSFCGDFQPYIAANKHVFQIEYPPSIPNTGRLSSEDEAFYCGNHDATGSDAGFSKILKFASAQLDGWGQFCGEQSFETPTWDG